MGADADRLAGACMDTQELLSEHKILRIVPAVVCLRPRIAHSSRDHALVPSLNPARDMCL